MLAAITGATGLVGGNLAVQLASAGWQVRCTRRATSKVGHLAKFPIEWVDGDLDDVAALTAAFTGADAVFHCAAMVSILPRATAELTAANVDGTRNVVDAVRRAGAKRLVHCSTVGAVGLSEDGRPCTEEARWNFAEHGMADGYSITKHRAEEVVREAVAAGLDAVIVNPTYMFGPYDARPSSGRLIVDTVLGKTPGWSTGANNFVDVRDVTEGMRLAFERGLRGERYILGGENTPYRVILETIARVAGVPAPRFGVPRFLAAAAGFFGDIQQTVTGHEPLLNSVTVKYAYCNTFQFSSEKARREIGYTTGSIETAIGDAIRWFREAGMLPSA